MVENRLRYCWPDGKYSVFQCTKMFLFLGMMAVPDIPKGVLDLDAQTPVTAKTDVHGNDVLCQSRHKNASVKQTARGNKGLNIGRLKLQVSIMCLTLFS